uniref:Laminin subunit alpha-5 n=1 Tax=Sphaerodactylus townsendi TaxID=933632 RepID=A0ACB8F6Q9_9SAUR
MSVHESQTFCPLLQNLWTCISFLARSRQEKWIFEDETHISKMWILTLFTASKRDCIEKFGLKTVERITKDNDVICTTEYSRIVPLENGEIVVSLVNGRPGAMNFSYSPLLRNFTKATNIRLRFLQTNTLLGHLMGKALRDPTVTRRYYYSIKDISIGGRCVCHGHADVCDAKDPTDPYRSLIAEKLSRTMTEVKFLLLNPELIYTGAAPRN